MGFHTFPKQLLATVTSQSLQIDWPGNNYITENEKYILSRIQALVFNPVKPDIDPVPKELWKSVSASGNHGISAINKPLP